MKSDISETPDILVRDIPCSIHSIVVEEQTREKKRQGVSNVSLSSTIKKIIKEWADKCREKR